MHRDAGSSLKAQDKFKMGLQFNKRDPVVWTLLGNMSLAEKEWGPAEKKFEHILKDAKDDPYSLLSRANMWLEFALSPTTDEAKRSKYLKGAKDEYKKVLHKDPTNIYAAHGIGCVEAGRKNWVVAKEIFIQVREATSDAPEPWLNLAHVYCEQGLYVNAIKLYENCLRRMYGGAKDALVLTYLARANFRAKKFPECKRILTKAIRIAPQDLLIRFNLGLAQVALARSMLEQDGDQTSWQINEAISNLSEAASLFKYLKGAKSTKFTKIEAEEQEKRAASYQKQAASRKKRVEAAEAVRTQNREAQEQRRNDVKQAFQEEEDRRKEQEFQEQQRRLERIQAVQGDIEANNLLEVEFVAAKQPRAKGEGKKRKKKGDGDDDVRPYPTCARPTVTACARATPGSTGFSSGV